MCEDDHSMSEWRYPCFPPLSDLAALEMARTLFASLLFLRAQVRKGAQRVDNMAGPHTLASLSSMGALGRSNAGAASLAPWASIGGSVGSEEGPRRAHALCLASQAHAARPTTGGRKLSAARGRVLPRTLLRWAPQHRCAHGRQSHPLARGPSRPSATHLVRCRTPQCGLVNRRVLDPRARAARGARHRDWELGDAGSDDGCLLRAAKHQPASA